MNKGVSSWFHNVSTYSEEAIENKIFMKSHLNETNYNGIFPHLYLVNICTCTQNKYMEIFIRPPFSLCHHGLKNTSCCLLVAIYQKKNEKKRLAKKRNMNK
jgi:hypothetical protein